MSKNRKIILIVAVIAVVLAVICSYSLKDRKKNESGKLSIVTTTFSTYDFSKQIVGDKVDVVYLLGPGTDTHGYEPSASDLIKIKNADVFVYVGGEMEKWVDKVFETDTIDKNRTKVIQVTDCIETIDEVEVDGAEEEEEEEEEEGAFDEHIWSSPTNAEKMVKYLCEKITELDQANKEFYQNNAEQYVAKIEDVRVKIQNIVDNKKRDRLVFGDKMPMQYFLNEFGLTASAAFNGCSTESEPSTKTITYLINKVKEEDIPVVLYIELSTGKTAKSIASETGKEAMQIQTLHNVSKEDFENGETYVSLMEKNLKVLEKALK